MRNKPETVHEYHIPGLHWWFLFSSIALIGCILLMIWTDYSGGEIPLLKLRGDRQWKNHQRSFFELEKKRLATDAKAAEIQANKAGLEKLDKELLTAREQIAQRRSEKDTIRAELKIASDAAFIVTRDFNMAKALRDEYRSFYEAALQRHRMNHIAPEVQDWERRVRSQNSLVDDLELAKQTADIRVANAQAKLNEIIGQEQEIERSISRLTGAISLLTNRLTELQDPLLQTVVNLPLLEFVAPTYKVKQIVTENHHVDVNFVTVPRVDRCTTCHMAIDRKDPTTDEMAFRKAHNIEWIEWSKLPHPLASHPKLDLFVGENSPHPASKYGCSVCHWGWDRETDFSRAGHTPRDKMQQKSWEQLYHWEHQEFLSQPMRNAKYAQASCLKCHTEQTNLPGGEKLDHGRRLIGQLGCWSCHKMKQLETFNTHRIAPGENFDDICKFYDVDQDMVRRLNNLPANGRIVIVKPEDFSRSASSPSEHHIKVGQELSIPIRTLHKTGPSLLKIATKTDKVWTRKWLADPLHFRHNTYMPRFWGMENSLGSSRDSVSINAVTEFLFTVSPNASLPPPPVTGNIEYGKKLVSELGCLACHVVDEKLMDLTVPDKLRPKMDDWSYRRNRTQGPQLAGTGSKTSENWLFAWLKNPKNYHPNTRMPNLRLDDQEAADIAAYLAGLRHTDADHQSLPDTQNPDFQSTLRDLTLEFLQVSLPRKLAEEKLNHLNDLIEPYFTDTETRRYLLDPGMFARDQAQITQLRAEFENTFDEALEAKANEIEAHIPKVKARIQSARDRVAALPETEKRNLFVGAKLIERYGCYACHDIHGFENAKPIGVELSEWGSKPVSKLDFGLLKLDHDRISWLIQKLNAPRSFDIGRVGITRTPQEHLKMPKFNLNSEQIEQIVTFVSGMTDEKLTYQEPRQLSPAEFHIERGRWLIKEFNCAGCHTIEGHGGAINATGLPPGLEPPMVSGLPSQLRQGQRTQPDWLFRFLKSPVTGEVRPWLKIRMPTYGLSDAEANVLVKYFAMEGHTQFPYVSTKINDDPAHIAAGKALFDKINCGLCHIIEGKALGKPLHEIPPEDLPRLAPNLSIGFERLQRDWLIDKWIPRGSELVPGTRMPAFSYSRLETEQLVDYVLSIGAPPKTTASTASSMNITSQPSSISTDKPE